MEEKKTDWRPLLGLGGTLLLVFGVFAPLFSMPLAGDLNYMGRGASDGWLILGFAALAGILTATGKYRLLLIPALLTGGVMAFTYFDFQSRLSAVEREGGVGGTSFASLVSMSWGWGVLAVGVILLAVAAFMTQPSTKVFHDEYKQ